MALKDSLLAEYDHEMAVARKVLEQVNPDKLSWQPHEKSMTLGRLAGHVAELAGWGGTILNDTEFNMVSGTYTPTVYANREEILATFDTTAAKTRALLDGKADAELMAVWTFKSDGAVVFALPRIGAWRSFVMNHLVHHRGQLTVYLRQTGSKVPAIYGPSADEA